MSVNFHAFQNIGVPFSECEALYEQWTQEFSGFEPERISRILNLKYDEEYLYITYFDVLYRLEIKEGKLSKQDKDGQWQDNLYFNECMVIYHLLKYTKDSPGKAGIWVPNATLDERVTRNRNMPDPLLTPFARKWSGNCAGLKQACINAGGKEFDKGDVAFQFAVFPFMEVQLIFWDADEDFPAQVQVLFDKKVMDYVHFETTGCVIADLFEKINLTAQEN